MKTEAILEISSECNALLSLKIRLEREQKIKPLNFTNDPSK